MSGAQSLRNQVYGWLLLLALGPQLMGHTAFNWALAHLSATFVALAILGEPVGSAIFAYFLFGESFAPLQLAGFTLLLAGIGLGILGWEYWLGILAWECWALVAELVAVTQEGVDF